MTDRAPCLHISRTTHPSPAPTRCVCIAAASLGVVLDDLTITPAPATLVLPWRTGPRFIAIAGPSGSGKSTLLRDIMRHARAIGETIITLPSALPPRPAIDLMRTEPIDAMRRLARAGLGDMRAFLKERYGEKTKLQLVTAPRGLFGRRHIGLLLGGQ